MDKSELKKIFDDIDKFVELIKTKETEKSLAYRQIVNWYDYTKYKQKMLK